MIKEMSFRHVAGFGKRMEYYLIGQMLMEGLDCYVPLVDDHGVDCVIKKEDGGFIEIQIKARSNQVTEGDAALFAGITHEFTENFYFVFFSERLDMALAEKVHEISMKYNVPLLIDDRVDGALAIGAEGVHLGQSDMPIDHARKIMGENYIIGATAKTVPQALEAYHNGADYLGVGAIYPTTTKVKTVLTSVDTLQAICEAVPIPVNAIGGLNKDNIDILKGKDISGICVVSAIMKAADSGKAAAELRQAVEGLL